VLHHVRQVANTHVEIAPTRREFTVEESAIQWRESVHSLQRWLWYVVKRIEQQTLLVARKFLFHRMVATHPHDESSETVKGTDK